MSATALLRRYYYSDAGGGDVTAPVLTSPGVTEIFAFGCYPSATTDTPNEGTAYAVITTSATAPSVAQVQAGQDHTGSAAVSSGSWSVGASFFAGSPQLGGLTHNTSGYYAHYTQDDAAGNDATVVSSGSFSTDDALPTGVETGDTTATGTLTSGFNTGVAVYYVVTESATTPSIAQVQAGQDHLGAAADASGSAAEAPTGVNTFNATGLTASTGYYFHYQYENEDNVDSPPLSSALFTTDAPDVAPVLSSPTGASTSASTAQGTVTTDDGTGTLYWVVTQSATQPSVVQIQAGQDHTGSAADASSAESVTVSGVQTVNAGGLAASTGYYFHFQQEDAATNDSNRVSSTLLTTPAASSDDYDLRFRDATYRRRFSWGAS